MKTIFISLAAFLACVCPTRAAEPQIIDLGNGAEIVVKDGRVEVRDRPGANAGSVSNSVSSHSDGSGGTVTTVTSERDGQSVTRTVTIGPDGKVSVDGAAAEPKPQPAAEPRAGGWMGVRSAPLSDAMRAQVDVPEAQGVVLDVVAPDGPAARAGLAVYDILLTLNGAPVLGVDDFRAKLQKAKPQQQMAVTYLRKGREGEASVTLDTPPAQAAAGNASETPAERMLREMQERMAAGKSGKTTVVGPDGKSKTAEGGDAFDLLLNDPNVPEAMKEQIRKSREAMKKVPGLERP